jgi:hypothetical protein
MEIVSRNKEAVMPGLDGTGPFGEGAKTGGGRGRCAVRNGEGASLAVGNGLGRRQGGRGLGRGRGNCFRSLKGSGQGMSITTTDKGKKDI